MSIPKVQLDMPCISDKEINKNEILSITINKIDQYKAS